MSEGRSKTQELATQRGADRGINGGQGTNCEDFVGARPVKRELDIEDLGVRVRLRTLTDGDSRVVHPYPALNGEFVWLPATPARLRNRERGARKPAVFDLIGT